VARQLKAALHDRRSDGRSWGWSRATSRAPPPRESSPAWRACSAARPLPRGAARPSPPHYAHAPRAACAHGRSRRATVAHRFPPQQMAKLPVGLTLEHVQPSPDADHVEPPTQQTPPPPPFSLEVRWRYATRYLTRSDLTAVPLDSIRAGFAASSSTEPRSFSRGLFPLPALTPPPGRSTPRRCFTCRPGASRTRWTCAFSSSLSFSTRRRTRSCARRSSSATLCPPKCVLRAAPARARAPVPRLSPAPRPTQVHARWGVTGLRFTVQSLRSPRELHARVDAFLLSFQQASHLARPCRSPVTAGLARRRSERKPPQVLADMPADLFASHVTSLINKKREPDMSLHARAARMFHEVVCETYAWVRRWRPPPQIDRPSRLSPRRPLLQSTLHEGRSIRLLTNSTNHVPICDLFILL